MTANRKYFVIDWRDASNYPAIDETNGQIWAWEFLRRSNAYGKHYSSYVLAKRRLSKKGVRLTSLPQIAKVESLQLEDLDAWRWVSHPGRRATEEEFEAWKATKPFGLRWDLAIRRTYGLALPRDPESSYSGTGPWFKPHPWAPFTLSTTNIHVPRTAKVAALMPYQILVLFDLREPYQAQIDCVSNVFSGVIKGNTKIANLRRHVERGIPQVHRWAMLRYLDAVRETDVDPTGDKDSKYLRPRFGYAKFLKTLCSDVEGRDVREYDILSRLTQSQLKKWSKDHFHRTIDNCGYLEFLRDA